LSIDLVMAFSFGKHTWGPASWQVPLTFALSLAIGCAAAPAPEPVAPDTASEGKLKIATQLHTQLATQLGAAPHDDLVHCQTTSGDCLISVAERRDEIVSSNYLNACRDPDAEKQGPCIVHALEESHKSSELAAYLETENWCSKKLLECTAALASDAAHQAARQRIKERRALIEADPRSVAATSLPEFAKEKLAFVRSTLPPKAQDNCSGSAPPQCAQPLKAPRAAFEAEIAKAPASYDTARAQSLYVAIYEAEADCTAPELSCLQRAMAQYGGSTESEKLFQQNLGLLGKQQQIRAKLDPDAADECLSSGVAQYRDRIISSYQGYAGNPAAPALVQLQKAFVTLHNTQLACLSRLGKPAKH